ncbi:hypothetical protein BDV93DRAFT_517505 [Ceratobasidium sp. AG-I]|nr:hypothetical protein BDV93DRAFT_517505 [Ceratobasidium sp. AG-I]
MSAYGQMPVGGFMSSDISDHHNYGHTCSAPQPQPAPPNRTWTEQVWGSATTRPPLRTDSPGGIDTCTCGRDCAGGDTCLL